MKISAMVLRDLFTNKTVDIMEIRPGEGPGTWAISGSMDGYDFTLPMTNEQAKPILDTLFCVTSDVKKELASMERRQKKANGNGESMEPRTRAPKPTITATPEVSTKPVFTPPQTPCQHTRKRLTKEELALLKRFEDAQRKLSPDRKRRSRDELRKMEVARSYLLAGRLDTVTSWIKHCHGLQ